MSNKDQDSQETRNLERSDIMRYLENGRPEFKRNHAEITTLSAKDTALYK
jgi:hypothetical protein